MTIEPDNVVEFAKTRNLTGDYADWCKSDEIRDFVQGVLDGVNGELASYETIKKFKVLDKDFEIGDELTPTLKVKRKHATEKYMPLLSTMYDEQLNS